MNVSFQRLGAAAAALVLLFEACTHAPAPVQRSSARSSADEIELLKAGPADAPMLVVTNETHLRTVEQEQTYTVLPPAYSPDGSQLCYLRIRSPLNGPTSGPAVADQPLQPHDPAKAEDFDGAVELAFRDTELVFRDAQSDAVLSTVPITPDAEVKHVMPGLDRILDVLLLNRPQWHPDGRRVYVWLGAAYVVDRARGSARLLAGPVERMELSPDGRLLATLHHTASGQPIVSLFSTEQSSVRTIEPGRKPIRDLAWKGNDELVILRLDPDDGAATMEDPR